MPDIIFAGPAGRIEGRYQRQKNKTAPMALVLHPHPQFGGTMNNRSSTTCSTVPAPRLHHGALQFPRRRPQPGHVRQRHRRIVGRRRRARLDAHAQPRRPRLLGRRHLLRRLDRHAASDAPAGDPGFVSIAPPASMYDFAFLAPCPASGLIVHGSKDQVVPEADVQKLVDRLTAQKGIKITYNKIDGANHFFDNHIKELKQAVEEYLDMRMPPVEGASSLTCSPPLAASRQLMMRSCRDMPPSWARHAGGRRKTKRQAAQACAPPDRRKPPLRGNRRASRRLRRS